MYILKGMTLKEFIQRLEHFDPETEVTLRLTDLFIDIDTSTAPWKINENVIITITTVTNECMEYNQRAIIQQLDERAQQQQMFGSVRYTEEEICQEYPYTEKYL